MKSFKFIIGVCFLFCATTAIASQNAIEILQTSLSSSLDLIFNDLQNWAVLWLGSFILLQSTLSNVRLLIHGAEIEKVFAKFAASLAWFSWCFYIFKNGANFIKSIATFLITKATGITGSEFDPMSPIDKGISVASTLLESLDGTQSVLGSLNPFPSLMMGLVALVILATSAIIAFKILMIFIETKIVIALSPFSFALLGLDAFKDQGLAPLKYLVSMAYRVMILAAIMSAMVLFSTNIIEVFKTLPAASDNSVWKPIWAAAMGYVLLAAVTLRSDSIATMLSSGSSQMTTGDASSSVMAAASGVAAGGALATAAATATGGAVSGAAKIPTLMSDYIAKMGGSISDASGRGAGQTPPPAPVKSLASRAAAQIPSSPPNRPASSGDSGSATASSNGGSSASVPSSAPTRTAAGDTSDGASARSRDSSGAPVRTATSGANDTATTDSRTSASSDDNGLATASANAESSTRVPEGAPVRAAATNSVSDNTAAGAPVRASAGVDSGLNAGIGGAGSGTGNAQSDQKLDQMANALAKLGQAPQKTVKDHLGEAGKQINQALQADTPGVNISMNTHSDHI